MGEYFEQRKIVQAVPVANHRVVDTHHHDRVVHEPRGMSAGAITALVISAIALTVMIMMLVNNSQQRDRDEQLAQERAAAAQQPPAQQQPPLQQAPVASQPPIVVTPQAQPSTQPAPSSASPSSLPTSAEVEATLRSRLLDDVELHSYAIEVTVSDGIATLAGEVPNDELKARAERLAKRVKGVASVINNISVQP